MALREASDRDAGKDAFTEVPYIDITIDPSFNRDPYKPLMELSRRHSIVRGRKGVFDGVQVPNNFMLPDSDQDIFLALSYDAVRRVMSDDENFSAEGGYGYSMGRTLGRTLFTIDEPDHGRYRRLVAKAFMHTSVSAEWLERHVRPIIHETIAEFEDAGRGDLVQLFTFHYPYRVIAAITGVPREHDATFAKLTHDSLLIGIDPERALRALGTINELLLEVIRGFRRDPKDNLINALINAEIDGDRLTDEEIALFLRVLIPAGLDTTFRATGNLLYLLLEHPEQFAGVRSDRSLQEAAIWESLRLVPPGSASPRTARRDMEIDGVHIPKGAGVMSCFLAANLDHRIWQNPECFDLHRPRKPIMTFGSGPHACLGNNLARLEMQIALDSLFERLPGLRKDEERWRGTEILGFGLRSVNRLPVVWDAKPQ